MLKLRVAITGGIGVGKTVACQLLKAFSSTVISCDSIVHELLSSNKACIKAVSECLGMSILDSSERIDREKVASCVFNDLHKLEQLEAIIHPRVWEEIQNQYRHSETSLFVVECPLLFELGWNAWFDATILITADQERIEKRLAASSLQHVEKRQKRLWSDEKKSALATYTVANNGTVEALKNQLVECITKQRNDLTGA